MGSWRASMWIIYFPSSLVCPFFISLLGVCATWLIFLGYRRQTLLLFDWFVCKKPKIQNQNQTTGPNSQGRNEKRFFQSLVVAPACLLHKPCDSTFTYKYMTGSHLMTLNCLLRKLFFFLPLSSTCLRFSFFIYKIVTNKVWVAWVSLCCFVTV